MAKAAILVSLWHSATDKVDCLTWEEMDISTDTQAMREALAGMATMASEAAVAHEAKPAITFNVLRLPLAGADDVSNDCIKSIETLGNPEAILERLVNMVVSAAQKL